jgi:hypothetical protein
VRHDVSRNVDGKRPLLGRGVVRRPIARTISRSLASDQAHEQKRDSESP